MHFAYKCQWGFWLLFNHMRLCVCDVFGYLGQVCPCPSNATGPVVVPEPTVVQEVSKHCAALMLIVCISDLFLTPLLKLRLLCHNCPMPRYVCKSLGTCVKTTVHAWRLQLVTTVTTVHVCRLHIHVSMQVSNSLWQDHLLMLCGLGQLRCAMPSLCTSIN